MDILFGLSFIIVFVVCVSGMVLQSVFLNMLKRRHPQAWNDLGCPSFLNNSIRSCWNVMRFIKRERFRDLGDKQLTSFGIFLKWFTLAYLLLFLLTLVQFFWPIFSRFM